MKLINKPVKDVYPDAEELFTRIYNKYNINIDSISSFIIIKTIIYIVLIIFFTICGIQSHIIFNIGFLFIYLILYFVVGDVLWRSFDFIQIYYYKDLLIFSMSKKINVIFNASELSYIILKEYNYKDYSIHSKKYHFFSQHHEVIFQIGLLRFVIDNVDGHDFDNQIPPLYPVINQLFERLNSICNNLEILNDYNYWSNNHHLKIELNYQFKHFFYMMFLIFVKPIYFIFNAVINEKKYKI